MQWCDKCNNSTYSIHLTIKHERLCGRCMDLHRIGMNKTIIDEAKDDKSEIENLTVRFALQLASNYINISPNKSEDMDLVTMSKKTDMAAALSLLALANSLSTVRDAGRILRIAKNLSKL